MEDAKLIVLVLVVVLFSCNGKDAEDVAIVVLVALPDNPTPPLIPCVAGIAKEERIDTHGLPKAAGIAYEVAQIRVFSSDVSDSIPPSFRWRE